MTAALVSIPLLCIQDVFICAQQPAQLRSKVTSDWPMAAHHMKEELNCATIISGELFVMTAGEVLTLEWHADN